MAVLSVQLAWLAIGFSYGFDTAHELMDNYLWRAFGILYVAYFVIRAPMASGRADSDIKPSRGTDA